MVARVTKIYESEGGDVHVIKLSPEIAAVAGTDSTGTSTSDIKPKLSKSNREFGLRPRLVIAALTKGTAPDTFKVYKRVPVMTPTQFASAAYANGATLTIDEDDHEIVSRFPEDY